MGLGPLECGLRGARDIKSTTLLLFGDSSSEELEKLTPLLPSHWLRRRRLAIAASVVQMLARRKAK